MKSPIRHQKGFAHQLFIIAIVVIAVVGSAGFLVYKKTTERSAKAYNWTQISRKNPARAVTVWACKTDLGNRWKIRAYAKNNNQWKQSWNVYYGTSGKGMTGGLLAGSLGPGATSNVHYFITSNKDSFSLSPYTGDLVHSSSIANC